MILARDFQRTVGYQSWEKFHPLVLKAVHLIENCAATGVIQKTTRNVSIGKGAIRTIVDYKLDADSQEVILGLAHPRKLSQRTFIRNETVILSLVKKYCEAKSIPFVFQQRVGKYIFDACINGHLLIEFDEPHHTHPCEKRSDESKERSLIGTSYSLLRFSVEHDIVDIIPAL